MEVANRQVARIRISASFLLTNTYNCRDETILLNFSSTMKTLIPIVHLHMLSTRCLGQQSIQDLSEH